MENKDIQAEIHNTSNIQFIYKPTLVYLIHSKIYYPHVVKNKYHVTHPPPHPSPNTHINLFCLHLFMDTE